MSTTSIRPAGAATRVRAAAPGGVTRRRLELALGGVWLLDGALQFQPSMFSKSFFADLLGMANMGLPGPLAALVYRVSGLVGAHPVAWNVAFASLPRKRRRPPRGHDGSGTLPAGASGMARSRTPQARKMALPMAGATAMIGVSPPPADGSSGRSISTT